MKRLAACNIIRILIKKTDFTAINNGTLTISTMLNKDEITGSFNGWGLSGNDTLYLSGTFNRKKK